MTDLVTSPPLRLMIYDAGDTKTTFKRLREGISKEANRAIDHLDELLPGDFTTLDLDIPYGLTYSWLTGGRFYRMLGRIDNCKGFLNWADALEWLATFGGDRKIGEIQFWGHGSPGKVWMVEGRETLKADAFDGEHREALISIRKRMTPDAHIWFRCCNVFTGDAGHDFARSWSSFFERRIIAHTFIINVWHAGLHNAWPNRAPHWPKMEGIIEGTSARPKKLATSSYGSPCRTWFLGNNVPEGW